MVSRYDGEFWMEFFKDFCGEFEVAVLATVPDPPTSILPQEVSICTLGPDFDHDGQVDAAKYMKITFGQVGMWW